MVTSSWGLALIGGIHLQPPECKQNLENASSAHYCPWWEQEELKPSIVIVSSLHDTELRERPQGCRAPASPVMCSMGARSRHWCLPQLLSIILFLRQDLSLNQESIDLARPGQRAPRISLSLLPKVWGYRNRPLCSVLVWMLGMQTQATTQPFLEAPEDSLH